MTEIKNRKTSLTEEERTASMKKTAEFALELTKLPDAKERMQREYEIRLMQLEDWLLLTVDWENYVDVFNGAGDNMKQHGYIYYAERKREAELKTGAGS